MTVVVQLAILLPWRPATVAAARVDPTVQGKP
jgi:hypothetical protein